MTTASDRSSRYAPPYRLWLWALAGLLVVGTFALVGVGGSVTSHGAGMAVPDWPGTFGYNMFLAPLDVWFRDPETGQFFQGRFWEHSHRLIGSAVGFITIALAVALWITQRGRPWLRWLGLSLLGAVIIQGLMGGFRVTENSPLLAAVHGVFGQLVLAVTVLIAAAVGRTWLTFAPRDADTARSGSADTAGDDLLRWEIFVLPGLVLLGLVASMALGGGDEDDLIMWSVSDVGLVWIVCMAAYIGICLWRLWQALPTGRSARPAAGESRCGRCFAPRCGAIVLLVLLVGQLVLGAAVRHAGAERAITDAPLVFGGVLPPLSEQAFELAVAQLPPDLSLPPPTVTLGQVWLHWTHRAWAILVAVAVIGVAAGVWRHRDRLNLSLVLSPLMLVVAVTFLQIMLGVMTVWSEIHPTMATYHQATGAALLGLTTWLVVRTSLMATPAALDRASPLPLGASGAPGQTGYNDTSAPSEPA